jgi:hypothetical protein
MEFEPQFAGPSQGLQLDNTNAINAKQARSKKMRAEILALGPVVNSGIFTKLSKRFGVTSHRVSVIHRELFPGVERQVLNKRSEQPDLTKADVDPEFLDEQGERFRAALPRQVLERLGWQSRRVMMLMQTGRFDLARRQLDECERQLQNVESEQDLEDTLIADLEHRSSIRWGNALEEIGVFTVRDFLERRKEEIIKLPNFGPTTYQQISDACFKVMQRRGESSVVKS